MIVALAADDLSVVLLREARIRFEKVSYHEDGFRGVLIEEKELQRALAALQCEICGERMYNWGREILLEFLGDRALISAPPEEKAKVVVRGWNQLSAAFVVELLEYELGKLFPNQQVELIRSDTPLPTLPETRFRVILDSTNQELSSNPSRTLPLPSLWNLELGHCTVPILPDGPDVLLTAEDGTPVALLREQELIILIQNLTDRQMALPGFPDPILANSLLIIREILLELLWQRLTTEGSTKSSKHLRRLARMESLRERFIEIVQLNADTDRKGRVMKILRLRHLIRRVEMKIFQISRRGYYQAALIQDRGVSHSGGITHPNAKPTGKKLPSISELRRLMAEYNTQLAQLEVELHALPHRFGSFAQDYGQFERILGSDVVSGMTFLESRVTVVTQRLQCAESNTRKSAIDLGQIEVRFDFPKDKWDPKITFFNRSFPESKSARPRIKQGGEACWGNYSRPIAQGYRERNLAVLSFHCITFLQTTYDLSLVQKGWNDPMAPLGL